VNDVSEREYQMERGGTWDKGKGCDSFGPVGPWLVTADEIPDPQKLDLWLDVNAQRMQQGNCITPAAIRTVLFDQMTKEHIDFMLSKIPLGRFGRIEEATALICWLASEDCSFSTGAVFDLSGGRATY
jgi:hypothetical protein